ncbi:hypothetical protein glysoja_035430, partial [Glycine soja]
MNWKVDPVCSCDPKCMCNALTSVMERKKQDQVMQFLRGLYDQFNIVRSNVLMMDPLPSIAKVFSYVVQEERQLNSNDVLGNTSLINAVNTNSSNSGNLCTYYGRGSKLCIHYGLTSHTIDECYRKHGYPPRQKLNKYQSSNINNISNVKEEGDSSAQERNQETQNEDVKLTTQQYKALMALLQ